MVAEVRVMLDLKWNDGEHGFASMVRAALCFIGLTSLLGHLFGAEIVSPRRFEAALDSSPHLRQEADDAWMGI